MRVGDLVKIVTPSDFEGQVGIVISRKHCGAYGTHILVRWQTADGLCSYEPEKLKVISESKEVI